MITRVLFVAACGVLAMAGPRPSLLAAGEVTLEVCEVAGLARGGYPMSHRLQLPQAVRRTTPFSLHDDRGEPVAAQFLPASEKPMEDVWWLDFPARLAPWECRRFQVAYGDGVQAAAEGRGGHRLSTTGQAYQVANAPYITWTVARDLAGLLRSVDFPPQEHLRPGSPGLMLRDRAGLEHVLGAGFHTGRVVRDGRRAVALRFTGAARDTALAGVRSRVDLVFPSPVSWVEVDWTLDDPGDRVAELGAALRLNLDPPRPEAPTLVDFGAGTWVYASLAADQAAELQASGKAATSPGPEVPWRVLRGPAGRLTPIAVAPARKSRPALGPDSQAEGWAHIMDRRRCLALAIDEFGHEGAGRISLSGKGDVALWRQYDPQVAERPLRPKRFHFWLHFVHYPPQYSAATSPHMMQTPPRITVLKGARDGAKP
jgi:hypothetical protein